MFEDPNVATESFRARLHNNLQFIQASGCATPVLAGDVHGQFREAVDLTSKAPQRKQRFIPVGFQNKESLLELAGTLMQNLV